MDRGREWCTTFDTGTFGTILRAMRDEEKKASGTNKDVNWYDHFKAAKFGKGEAIEEVPDVPDRAEAVDALVMTVGIG